MWLWLDCGRDELQGGQGQSRACVSMPHDSHWARRGDGAGARGDALKAADLLSALYAQPPPALSLDARPLPSRAGSSR